MQSSTNAEIAFVSRRGAMRSSINEVASNNRLFGSSSTNMPASDGAVRPKNWAPHAGIE